jgi:hypothetical protein
MLPVETDWIDAKRKWLGQPIRGARFRQIQVLLGLLSEAPNMLFMRPFP